MKKILSFFMVALLAALLVVPCFAAETTAASVDYVDWFGSGTYVSSYTLTYSGQTDDLSSFKTWLSAVGATSASSAVGTFQGTFGGYNLSNQSIYLDGTTIRTSSDNTAMVFLIKANYSSSSALGLSEAQSISWATVTTTESGSNGFVDSGVSDALTELSTIVSAILSNQYILIAIGLAVAVPLVAWGISKIKSLVKGY